MEIEPEVKLAKHRFNTEVGPGTFEHILLRCAFWGVIVKTPGLFLLAEPVWSDGKSIAYEGKGNPNCWWIHWVSGRIDPSYFTSLVEPVEYFGYERQAKGKLKIWRWEQSRGYKG